MVERDEFDSVKAFACEVCGHHYREKRDAERCEAACDEEGMCDPDLHEDALEDTP
jgi:hypothetical protein